MAGNEYGKGLHLPVVQVFAHCCQVNVVVISFHYMTFYGVYTGHFQQTIAATAFDFEGRGSSITTTTRLCVLEKMMQTINKLKLSLTYKNLVTAAYDLFLVQVAI